MSLTHIIDIGFLLVPLLNQHTLFVFWYLSIARSRDIPGTHQHYQASHKITNQLVEKRKEKTRKKTTAQSINK